MKEYITEKDEKFSRRERMKEKARGNNFKLMLSLL